tara:strand:+ start:338 stop:2083 length:1746 start_codon:yes stop_codon:yes gene_type:complete
MTEEDRQASNEVEALINMIKRAELRTKELSGTFENLVKHIAPVIATIKKANADVKQTQIQGRNYLKAQKNEYDLKGKLNQQMNETIRLRAREKKEVERIHGEHVRRNIELRHALENTTSSFRLLGQAVGGIGFGQAGRIGLGHIGDLFSASHKKIGVETEISKMQDHQKHLQSLKEKGMRNNLLHYQDLAEASGRGIDEVILKGEGGENRQRYVDMMQSRQAVFMKSRDEVTVKQGELQNSPVYKILKDHPTIAKLLARTERFAKWADENKTGIAISLISMGIFIGLLKKMFDASPMLQKMFSLFKVMFDLVLRPFGDMIGFFLLPVLKVVMNAVLPWFSKVYPTLIQWGMELGNKFAAMDIMGLLTDIKNILAIGLNALGLFGLGGGTSPEQEAGRSVLGASIAGAGVMAGGGIWAAKKLGGKGRQVYTSGGEKVKSGGAKMSKGLGRMAMFGAKGALKAIPIVGWMALAAEIGLAAVKKIDPIAYAELRKNAEWMGMARDFMLPEDTILEGYGLFKGNQGSGLPITAGGAEGSYHVDGDTYNFYGVEPNTAVAVIQETTALSKEKVKNHLSLERDTRYD